MACSLHCQLQFELHLQLMPAIQPLDSSGRLPQRPYNTMNHSIGQHDAAAPTEHHLDIKGAPSYNAKDSVTITLKVGLAEPE